MAKFTKLIKDGESGGSVTKEAVKIYLTNSSSYPADVYEITDHTDPYNTKVQQVASVTGNGNTSFEGYTNTFYLIANSTLTIPLTYISSVSRCWARQDGNGGLVIYCTEVGEPSGTAQVNASVTFRIVDDM